MRVDACFGRGSYHGYCLLDMRPLKRLGRREVEPDKVACCAGLKNLTSEREGTEYQQIAWFVSSTSYWNMQTLKDRFCVRTPNQARHDE
jgi:hypothetical protein